ncbi:hypothetical protein J6590_089782 [Homalodisca vitripennis]|nr:hypothetical protein J6590_089782 [Homalodisca vitripennis]
MNAQKTSPRPRSFLQHLKSLQSPLSLPQPSRHTQVFFLVYALRMVHLQPPRRPPQPSGRKCDGTVGTCQSDLQVAGLQDYATSPGRQWCEFRDT